MFDKLPWYTKRTFGGLSITYLRQEIEHYLVMARLWFVILVLIPCFDLCNKIMKRSGVRQATLWLIHPRQLTETDRSHLFVAAFVSFLFLNISTILLFSSVVYDENWLFFAGVLTLFFFWLLFNLDYMRKWLGIEGGQRPDEQLVHFSSAEVYVPLHYCGRSLLFLIFGEVRKLLVGFFWFFVISFLFVMPIYLRFW